MKKYIGLAALLLASSAAHANVQQNFDEDLTPKYKGFYVGAGLGSTTMDSSDDYLNFVRSMHMGVGCFQKYSAWSISTTDGLSQGVPYVLPNGMCYPEMVGEQYPLLYKGKDGFKSTIEYMLDNPNAREEANKYLVPKLNDFRWS